MPFERRTEGNVSVNVSGEKRSELMMKLGAVQAYLSSLPQDGETARLLAYLEEIREDVDGKKYGLVFEDHREAVDEILSHSVPVATEETELRIENGGETHLLVEGDNLAALHLLRGTHASGVDVIYIDPPYNTGNKDFVYDDAFVESKDAYRHSKWLSFMAKRLIVSRELLQEDGVIFISIDEKEVYDLKLLLDEIFGEKNFLNDIIWLNNLKGRQIGVGGAVKTYEHILCYAKDASKVKTFVGNVRELKKTMPSVYRIAEYPVLHDDKGDFVIKNELYNTNSAFNEDTRPNLVFNILYAPATGAVAFSDPFVEEPVPEGYVLIPPHKNADGTHAYHAWRWSKQKILAEKEDLYFRAVAGGYKVYTKIRDYDKTSLKDVITDVGNGNAEILALFGKAVFSYPKSTKLLRILIGAVDKKDAVVLDFFAGSGTTGHAVMALNKADGGRRRFILCTNNENGICRSVTYERIRRAIEKEGYEASLMYLKVDFVPKEKDVE